MNNDSIRGYVILTLENCGYSKEEINKALDELHLQFDTMTEEEAEQYYLSGVWNK